GIWTCKIYTQAGVHEGSKKVTLKVNGITAPPCYYECGIDHEWVCGTNNKSYQNPCMFKISACEAQKTNITIKHHGKCVVVKECVEEPFTLPVSKKHFIILKDKKRNWHYAKIKCDADYLRAVHPTNEEAVKLRKHLLDSCGDLPVWLNARADGKKFVWKDTETELNRKDELWLQGDPTSIFDRIWHYLDKRITEHHCLNLAVWFKDWSKRPTRVYASSACSSKFYTLCEACPVGFWLESSKQCFKFLNDELRNWQDAKQACLKENAVLANPADEVAVALRKHILDKYGELWWGVWLDGMAPAGSRHMMVQRNQTELRQDHHLWMAALLQPLYSYEQDMCLMMLISQRMIKDLPTQVYATLPCTGTQYTLCEAIFE
ncbi:unnamed protein product, partial [Meganyctiphanes norvegica]